MSNQARSDDRKVRFRIGINLGDVIVDKGEIYGDGVNIAARLESLADPGGIRVSEAVRTAAGTFVFRQSIAQPYPGLLIFPPSAICAAVTWLFPVPALLRNAKMNVL